MKVKWKIQWPVVAAVLLFAFGNGPVLAQEAAPAWNELTEQQQRVLAPFADRWDSLEGERRERTGRDSDRERPRGERSRSGERSSRGERSRRTVCIR